jgi:hypothetical protein
LWPGPTGRRRTGKPLPALDAWCKAHPLLAPRGDSIERDRSDPIYFVVHDLEREKRLLHEMRRLEYVEAILTTYAAEPERREGLEVIAQIRALEETLRPNEAHGQTISWRRKAPRPRVRTTDFRCQACGQVFDHDAIVARAKHASQSDTISNYLGCGCGLVVVVGLVVGITKFVMSRGSHTDPAEKIATASAPEASSPAAPPPHPQLEGRARPQVRSGRAEQLLPTACMPCSTQEDFDRP